MEIAFIYDRNKMDSVFTAAAILSQNVLGKTFRVFERSGIIDPNSDMYYWLGVFPSRMNFNDWRTAEKKSHTAFTDMASMVYSKGHELEGVHWYGNNNTVTTKESSTRVYGRASLLETVFESLGLKFGMYSLAIEQMAMYYQPNPPIELLVGAHASMRSALEHIAGHKPGWVALSKITSKDYDDMAVTINKVRGLIDTSSRHDVLTDSKKKEWSLFTTYMNEDFWAARRFLELRNAKYRNISYVATGMNVITNAVYCDGLTKQEPNFVF